MPSLINADNGVVSGSVGLKYSTDNTGTLALQTNGNTAVTIDSSSRVGIGTTTPSNPLHIVNSGANINLLNLVGTNSYTSTALGGEGPIRLQNTNTTNGNMSSISNYDGNGNMNSQINFINMNHSGTGDIAFTTRAGGSFPEKMRIDSGGRVTIPNQPSFRVGTNFGYDASYSGVVVFETATHNVGSCYNTSNGRFTAPVFGYYFFAWGVLCQNSGAVMTDHSIRVNGSTAVNTRFNSPDAQQKGSVILRLNAGDYVEYFKTTTGGNSNIYAEASWSYFSGHLLS